MKDYQKEELMLRVQSKKASMAEAVVNTIVGLVIAMVLNEALFVVYHVKATHAQTFQIVMWMTLASVIRGYVLRRFWNSEWWKRWSKKKVNVTQLDYRVRTIVQLSTEMANLTREQKKSMNQRLLNYLDKELERVLYGGKR